MPQPQGVLAGRTPRSRLLSAAARHSRPSAKLILCVLPRGLGSNPLLRLLNGYRVVGATTAVGIMRLVQAQAYDGYVVHSPLGWIDSAEACRRIRGFDLHTPLIVFTHERSTTEKQDVIAAGAHAYVARDDAHNLTGTAAQLIMLAELRSLDAMTAGGAAIQEKLVRRLAKLRDDRTRERSYLPRAQARLKLEARKLFGDAGGSRAHFERVWPALYERALSAARSSDPLNRAPPLSPRMPFRDG